MAKLAEDKGPTSSGRWAAMTTARALPKDPDGTPLHFINMAKYRRTGATTSGAAEPA